MRACSHQPGARPPRASHRLLGRARKVVLLLERAPGIQTPFLGFHASAQPGTRWQHPSATYCQGGVKDQAGGKQDSAITFMGLSCAGSEPHCRSHSLAMTPVCCWSVHRTCCVSLPPRKLVAWRRADSSRPNGASRAPATRTDKTCGSTSAHAKRHLIIIPQDLPQVAHVSVLSHRLARVRIV